MNTWAATTYTINARSQIFLDYISIRIDEISGLPYISKKYPCEWKEIELIQEGDIVYCINDMYFSNTTDLINQNENVKRCLECDKRFCVKLISRRKFIDFGIPRIEQIIVPEMQLKMDLETCTLNMSTCITNIECEMFKSIAGSTLLAINNSIVLNKTPESIQLMVSQLHAPFILLISCPYQESSITQKEIVDYISHNDILTNNSSTFQDVTKTIHWSESNSSNQDILFEKELLKQSFSHQNDYTNQPFAVDSFMFPQSQGYAILEQSWNKANEQRWKKNEQEWYEFLKTIGGIEQLNFSWTRQSGRHWSYSLSSSERNRNTLRSLIREGIPNSLRPNVWYYLSGAAELKQRSVNSYYQYWHSQIDSSIISIINQDLLRTFPTHPLFSNPVTSLESSSASIIKEEAPFIQSLQHILLAISVIRDDIQYFTGMNLLAGLLLIVVMEEEKAFWILAAMLQYTFPPNYFDSTLSGVRIDESIIEDILHEKFPLLVQRLEAFDKKLLSISLQWIMNMFINVFPIATVVRIWDIVLLEGDKILLKIIISLISINEEMLMNFEDDSDLAYAFKKIGVLQFNVDELFTSVFRSRNYITGELPLFPYTRDELEEVRKKKREEMIMEESSQNKTVCIIDSDEELIVYYKKQMNLRMSLSFSCCIR